MWNGDQGQQEAGMTDPSIDDEKEAGASSTARALARVHPRLRPWHLFAALGAVVITVLVVVLSLVLVHERDQREQEEVNQQVQTPTNLTNARVNLGYAQYQGTLQENGVAEFLKLRYAAAPTGDLRWRAPVEPPNVTGDQHSDSFGKTCIGISTILPSLTEDEDCLFANVWAPTNATSDSKLPVWLFIQGGGYNVNINPIWNGSLIVERSGRNIVFVNFNYRVGLFGFLASERVRSDGDLNAGFLDQRMMLKWVQKYISQFGGDPDHVVINGVSAGAGSVALHLIANGGVDEHLFRGAIAESTFFPYQPPVAQLEWQFDLVLAQLGCTNTMDQMQCLRSQDVTALQLTNNPSPFPGRTASPLPLFYWTPCVDGELLQDLPHTMFENGDFIDVPMIFGTDNDEGTYFGVNAVYQVEVANFFQNNYPSLSEDNASAILEQYPLMPPLPQHNAWFPSAELAYGEATFICPTIHILNSKLSMRNSSEGWGFRYNVLDVLNAAMGLGVPHTWETWAVFGPDNLLGPGLGPASYYTYDAEIVAIVMDYWISFVRTLDPNPFKNELAPQWDSWDAAQHRLQFALDDNTMEETDPDQLTRCEFWNGLASVMNQ
ncbi:Alpha/Beta hydrolase protein [Xylariales sp. PMI_506]|nr:Alpha/Beta hydrolase protein [Xylariales sp. PMI_506]